MKIRAQDIINLVDTVDSADDLDAILSLTVDDAIQLALRKSANTRLEPVWYEKILAKLGDHEKEMFTLGLASSGIKVVPTTETLKKASIDIASHTDRIKKHLEKLVADKGYISEDEYRDALWDKTINGNVPDKVVGDINAWIMQSMIPLKKTKPKGDVTPGYRKKVMDQLKHPNVNTFKASKVVASHTATKNIIKSRLYSITALLEEHADYRLSKADKRVIVSFVDQKTAESNLLSSDGKELRIEVPMGGGVIARWVNDKIKIGDLGTRSEQTVVNYLRKVTPKFDLFEKDAQATDFAGEQSELERAIMSWEPRLKNIKEWLGDVARAKNFSDLKKLWDRLWATKEETAFEIDPRKHDFKEYVDLGDDDGGSLDLAATKRLGRDDDAVLIARWEATNKKHWVEVYKDKYGYGFSSSSSTGYLGALPSDDDAIEAIESRLADFAPDVMKTPLKRVTHLKKTLAAMGGAEGDEEIDKYQQAYDAVGGDADKMVRWLKKNKGVDTTAAPELNNAINDWLKNHKKTGKGEALDADTMGQELVSHNRYAQVEDDEDLEEKTALEDDSVDEFEEGPEPEDIVISDSGPLGSNTSVGVVEGKFIGEFHNDSTSDAIDKAEDAIVRYMLKHNFYPSIWYESDHGNLSPYALSERSQKNLENGSVPEITSPDLEDYDEEEEMENKSSHLKRAIKRISQQMEPEIIEGDWVEIDGPEGTEWVPLNLVNKPEVIELMDEIEHATSDDIVSLRGTSLEMYCANGELHSIEILRGGFGVRLSMPGYLDRTEWTVFKTREKAEKFLKEEESFYDEE